MTDFSAKQIMSFEASPSKLALADGTVVSGIAIGARGESGGELCFNTSMTGYQEIITDPSYHGQIMMMTYPHIGNYGAHDHDTEASQPMISALVVRAFSQEYSNLLAQESLHHYMERHGLVGITGIDTRKLVLHIRERGVMNAIISSTDLENESLIEKAEQWPSMDGLELASKVTCKEPYVYNDSGHHRVAVYDFGVKQNILRTFASLGCQVKVFPGSTSINNVLSWSPNGIFFSNGPGDPRAMPDSIGCVQEAMETGIPIFGICLGHQLMALSEGIDVFKMYVGHRGANQPVKNLLTGKVEVTTQNHGFSIDPESVDSESAEVTHVNLNDHTVEGLRFKKFQGFSVQYHPEASPGPHDSRYLFEDYVNMCSSQSSH